MFSLVKKVALFCGAVCLFFSCNKAEQSATPNQQSKESSSFMDVVRERYSCRSFDSVQVKKEHLDIILEAGRLAPTAKNLQEQHVYVCQSAESLAKIDSLCPCRYGAPTCLVVSWDTTNVFTYPGGKYNSGAEDATIVATHMMLAAKSVGVESCWLNFFNPEALRASLNIPGNETILMILPIGYASKTAAPNQKHFERKPIEETVTFK